VAGTGGGSGLGGPGLSGGSLPGGSPLGGLLQGLPGLGK